MLHKFVLMNELNYFSGCFTILDQFLLRPQASMHLLSLDSRKYGAYNEHRPFREMC